MGRREEGWGDEQFRMMTRSHQPVTPEVELLKKR